MGTLHGIMKYRNPDTSLDINRRLFGVMGKGVYDGDVSIHPVTTPYVLPVPGQLAVSVNPFIAMGADGMLVVHEGSPYILQVVAGQTQYVVCRSKYNTGADPTITLEVLTAAQYTTDPDRSLTFFGQPIDALIVLAKIVVPTGAIATANSQIDLRENHVVNSVSRPFIRGVFNDVASLPVNPPSGPLKLLTGDVALVVSTRQFYRWNGVLWETVTDGAVSQLLDLHIGVNAASPALNVIHGGTAITRDAEGYPAHPAKAILNVPLLSIAANNVQDAIDELSATEDVLIASKVNKTGDTMSGALLVTPITGTALYGQGTAFGVDGVAVSGGTGVRGTGGDAAAGGGLGGTFTGGSGTAGNTDGGAGVTAIGGNKFGSGAPGNGVVGKGFGSVAVPAVSGTGVVGLAGSNASYGVYGQGLNGAAGVKGTGIQLGVEGVGFHGVFGSTADAGTSAGVLGSTTGANAADANGVRGTINGAITTVGASTAAVFADASTATGVVSVTGLLAKGGGTSGHGAISSGATPLGDGVVGLGFGGVAPATAGTGVVGVGGTGAVGTYGVYGKAGGTTALASGVAGLGFYGVLGMTNTNGSAAVVGDGSTHNDAVGVFGIAGPETGPLTAAGVLGLSVLGTAPAVRAVANTAGASAVYATSTNGNALKMTGSHVWTDCGQLSLLRDHGTVQTILAGSPHNIIWDTASNPSIKRGGVSITLPSDTIVIGTAGTYLISYHASIKTTASNMAIRLNATGSTDNSAYIYVDDTITSGYHVYSATTIVDVAASANVSLSVETSGAPATVTQCGITITRIALGV